MEEIDAWLARDFNGRLWIYTRPPYKILKGEWTCGEASKCLEIDHNLFPEVQWSDEGPTKVKLEIVKQ